MVKILSKPTFNYEQSLNGSVVGVDEVGRGCLAGPVVACCAYINSAIPFELLNVINDSKLLKANKRELIASEITSYVNYEIATVSVEEIDKINILQASLKAMKIATEKLNEKIHINNILIDGNKSFETNIPAHTLIDGDNKSYSIAVASILAKVYRDKLMVELSADYPNYLWHKNAGYGTKAHLQAIKENGITEHHRKTFGIIKQYVKEGTL